MKKILICIIFLLLISTVHATLLNTGDELTINKKVEGNYYATGSILNVFAPVEGDLVAALGNISILKPIEGDITVAAGQFYSNAPVTGDARIAAGKLEILDDIKGDVLIAGGDISIVGDVNGDAILIGGVIEVNNVGRDFHATGGNVKINGIINGTAVISADNIEFAEDAKILGDLNYTAFNRVDEKYIKGEVIYVEREKENIFDRISSILFSLGSALLLGIILLFLFQDKIVNTSDKIIQKPFAALLWGTLALIITPIIIILFFITLIGIPTAIILLLFYIGILYFGKILLALAIGRLAFPKNNYFALLAGLVVYSFVRLLPFAGFIVAVAGGVLALGAIIMWFIPKKRILKKRRRK